MLTRNAQIVAKTRSQLNRRLADGKKLPWPPFGKQWYAGCTTLIVGNSAKAGIRTSALTIRSAQGSTDDTEGRSDKAD